MFKALVQIVLGYAIATAAAAAVLVVEFPLFAGGSILKFEEFVAAAAIIGIFAWAGLLFAIRARILGWTQPSTFALGGILAMLIGVASLAALSVGQGLMQGYLIPDANTVMSFFNNMVQMIALGLLPGLAGGLTYWLVAVPKRRVTV